MGIAFAAFVSGTIFGIYLKGWVDDKMNSRCRGCGKPRHGGDCI